MESIRANLKARALNAMSKTDSGDQTDAVKTIMVGSILLVISLVVAIFMFPVLTSGVAAATADTNTEPRDATLLGLLPTIFVVTLILGSIGTIFVGIKQFRA